MKDKIVEEFIISANSQSHVYPKALANFLFREIIEDAHCKYNISQEDMKAMCKQAVNRAAVFLKAMSKPDMYKAFSIYSIVGIKWDDPELTEDLVEELACLEKWGKEISGESM